MAATAQDSQAPLRAGGDKAKDDDLEDVEYSPFYGIEKGAVLQEARIFHSPNLDARRCQQVITKLLYLQHQGDSFSKKEASEVFFAVTKLFQSADMNLRRMVYLCLKDICPEADEVMIVTNSLMKDMNAREELYRANAIRVLRSIIDTTVLQQIERYFKQGIVDKSPVVAASALVAGLHLHNSAPEVVKRWSSEVTEAVRSKHEMVQFHAVALQTAIRGTDRLALTKTITTLSQTGVQSPLAQCRLIRYVSAIIKQAPVPSTPNEKRPFYDFLVQSLRHKSDMVMFQTARTIAEMKDATIRELAPAITVLHLFLTSGKPVLRFASVRLLNMISMRHPMAVTNCNMELETLMSDPNRSIAVYAITTLLKTGSEASIERLLKSIRAFMADIADDFKVVVVDAIRSLCEKFPAKHRMLMNFLSHMLREEGGYEFKSAIVEAILSLIKTIEGTRETGLMQLAEFIEDCEFTALATQVLHVLGELVPDCAEPAKFVRFIYNRINLENATVRAAAAATLANIAARCEPLRDRIVIILRRALVDNDDEVRDRCALYLAQIEGRAGGPGAVSQKLPVPLVNLRSALATYLDSSMEADFELSMVDTVVEEPVVPTKKGKKAAKEAAPAPPAPTVADELGKEVEAMPQFAALGARFKSCEPLALTEEDTEYVVKCVKHIFEQHIVLQFRCMNTIREQVLDDVVMQLDMADLEDFELLDDYTMPLKRMPHSAEGSAFAVLQREEGTLATGTAVAVMHFTTKEVDPTSGEIEDEGYEDEYQLEDLSISSADYLKPVPVANFKHVWDELGDESEVTGDYALGTVDGGIAGTVEAMIAHLSMHVAEATDVVTPNARSHTLMLSGELCGGHRVAARISFGLDAAGAMAMKVVTRASDPDVSEAMHAIVQEA